MNVDKNYRQEAPRAMGRFLGEMLTGMVESGMDRIEAVTVLIAYVQTLAAKVVPPPEDKPESET